MVVHAVKGIQEPIHGLEKQDVDRWAIIAESTNKEPQLGVKQRPLWPFIPLTNCVSSLLHCDEICIRNIIFELFRDVINEHIEIYAPGEESIRMGVPALKQIIGSTTTQRDNRDDSPDRINWMKLKCAVGRLPQMSLVGCCFRRNDKQPRRSHIRVKHNQTETPPRLVQWYGGKAQEGTPYIG